MGKTCVGEGDLREFLLGRMTDEQGEAVARHLEGCPACEAAARRLDGAADALVRSLRHALRAPGGEETVPGPGAGPPAGPPPAPAEGPLAGRVCYSGDYELGEKVGEGAVGVVHRAHDLGLGRELAVKVLRPEHRGQAELVRRFVAEARVLGRLQHPGIPPVHGRGELPDGRPFFTMKLVRGQTLEGLLRASRAPADDLPHFLAKFEQVCQAVAYAHSEGVIHRDLKPGNVMVGAFGEVQVMDWGFAKEVGQASAEEAAPAGRETVGAAATLAGPGVGTEGGRVMGTPAYMPPEQARGEAERVDRRSDVFGLGAILCEVLTGQPPFGGKTTKEALARAQACDHAEALARLDGCGADAELVRLCKACLAAEPSARPRDAGEIAQAVAAYQAEVQERLRRAELEKAMAEARAAGERKRRRLAVGLTATVVALTLGVSAWAWQRWETIRLTEADLDTVARHLDAEELPACREALERAEGRLGGGRPAGLRWRAAELRDLLGVVRRLEQARLTRASGVSEGIFDWASADEAYAKEFARYGWGGDNPDVEEVARRISASPIKGLLLAALDDWWINSGRSPAQRERLLAVAGRVDTDTWRSRLRNALASGDKAEVLRLAKEADPEQLPPSTLVMLGETLGRVGSDEAVRVLEAVQRRHPGDFWVNQNLALWLMSQKPARPGEAAGYFRAALAARPDSPGTHFNLGNALLGQGRPKEAEDEWRQALRLKPDYPEAHHNLGIALGKQGRPKEAEAECRQALRLKPDYPKAHCNLGLALLGQGRAKEAEAEFRQALRLDPDLPEAHCRLGHALLGQGRPKEAEAECRQALRLKPDYPEAHFNLGHALLGQGRAKEAEAEFRQALRLDPDLPEAHYNLGNALLGQGRPKEAEDEWRQALRLKPDYPEAHCNLGQMLKQQGRFEEALACLKRGHELGPNQPGWRYPSAQWVRDAERLVALDRKLAAILKGKGQPADVAERLALARFCQEYKKLPRAAACFYADAFAADPKLAADPCSGTRYSATCAAALAADGQGEDAKKPPDEERARWRQQALDWLRADLSAWTKTLEAAKPEARAAVRQTLQHWQKAPDLASLRDKAALDKLPAAERDAWQRLWADVDALRQRAQQK
jgi:serine/threonine-protein kinase